MEFSQEVISILVIVVVCALLSLLCVSLWFCRCRQDQIRAAEEKHERAVQMQHFEDQEKSKKSDATTLRVPSPNIDAEQQQHHQQSSQSLQSHQSSVPSNRETIGQFEANHSIQKVIEHPIRNVSCAQDTFPELDKHLDTISEIAISRDSLQRNDSKTNVFTFDSLQKTTHIIEVDDLNPGLDNSINLEKI